MDYPPLTAILTDLLILYVYVCARFTYVCIGGVFMLRVVSVPGLYILGGQRLGFFMLALCW